MTEWSRIDNYAVRSRIDCRQTPSSRWLDLTSYFVPRCVNDQFGRYKNRLSVSQFLMCLENTQVKEWELRSNELWRVFSSTLLCLLDLLVSEWKQASCSWKREFDKIFPRRTHLAILFLLLLLCPQYSCRCHSYASQTLSFRRIWYSNTLAWRYRFFCSYSRTERLEIRSII